MIVITIKCCSCHREKLFGWMMAINPDKVASRQMQTYISHHKNVNIMNINVNIHVTTVSIICYYCDERNE